MNEEKFSINRFFQLMNQSEAAKPAGLLASIRSLFARWKPRRAADRSAAPKAAPLRTMGPALPDAAPDRGTPAAQHMVPSDGAPERSAPPTAVTLPDGSRSNRGGWAGSSLIQPPSPGAAPAREEDAPQSYTARRVQPASQPAAPSEPAPAAADGEDTPFTHPAGYPAGTDALPPEPPSPSGDGISHPIGWEMPAAPTVSRHSSGESGGGWDGMPSHRAGAVDDPRAASQRRFAEIAEFDTNSAAFSRNSTDFYKSVPAAESDFSRPRPDHRPAPARDDPRSAARQIARVIERDARRY